MKIIFKFSIVLVLVFFAFGVHGQGGVIDTSGSPGVDLTIDDIGNRVTFLACWLSRVAIAIMVIMIVFYGLMFMTSQGDQAKYTDAKKALLWGIVGILVILGTYTIIATVANALGADYSFIPLACS